MEWEKERNGIESMTMTTIMTLVTLTKAQSILDLSWVAQGYIHIRVELEQAENIVLKVLDLLSPQFQFKVAISIGMNHWNEGFTLHLQSCYNA